MRELTYFIATSLDGFVSRNDGSIDDFAFDGEHVADLLAEYPETIPTHLRSHLNVADENRHFDTVLMGRATYEVGSSLGVTSPYQHLRQYLFSATLEQSPDEAVALVQSKAMQTVRELKAETGKGIWLCGGPLLASALVDEIDNVVIKVNPFLMGAGKTLFAEAFPKKTLKFVSRRVYENGFAINHFKIVAGQRAES